MKPPHKHFFSSLKQVEKRIKLDDGNPPSPPPQTAETPPTESIISSPIYFQNHHTNTSSSSSHHNNSISQPPLEFLSHNNYSNTSQSNPNMLDNDLSQPTTVDDVDSMIQLLGLSDFDGKGLEMNDFCDDEFYDKIVKVKGPKCKKEVERLDGWIKYFLNDDNGGLEPLRLAHLVLAKAAFVSVCSGGDGDRVEFPSTIDEFLRNDPPSD